MRASDSGPEHLPPPRRRANVNRGRAVSNLIAAIVATSVVGYAAIFAAMIAVDPGFKIEQAQSP